MFPCFLFFCLLFPPPPPAPVIPDGMGGFVPFTNSRVMPDGELRPYDPVIDGVMGPDGSIYFPVPPPPLYPPPYAPQGRVDVGPPEPYQPLAPRAPRAHRQPAPKHSNGDSCYGADGRPIEPVPQGCVTQSAPPMSGEAHDLDYD